jgi:hypothetical protein
LFDKLEQITEGSQGLFALLHCLRDGFLGFGPFDSHWAAISGFVLTGIVIASRSVVATAAPCPASIAAWPTAAAWWSTAVCGSTGGAVAIAPGSGVSGGIWSSGWSPCSGGAIVVRTIITPGLGVAIAAWIPRSGGGAIILFVAVGIAASFGAWSDGGQGDAFAFLIDVEYPDWDDITDLDELMRVFHEFGGQATDVDQAAAIRSEFYEDTKVRDPDYQCGKHGSLGECIQAGNMALDGDRELEIAHVGEWKLERRGDRHQFGATDLPTAGEFLRVDFEGRLRHGGQGDFRHSRGW